jgi:hypothetical protein
MLLNIMFQMQTNEVRTISVEHKWPSEKLGKLFSLNTRTEHLCMQPANDQIEPVWTSLNSLKLAMWNKTLPFNFHLTTATYSQHYPRRKLQIYPTCFLTPVRRVHFLDWKLTEWQNPNRFWSKKMRKTNSTGCFNENFLSVLIFRYLGIVLSDEHDVQ